MKPAADAWLLPGSAMLRGNGEVLSQPNDCLVLSCVVLSCAMLVLLCRQPTAAKVHLRSLMSASVMLADSAPFHDSFARHAVRDRC